MVKNKNANEHTNHAHASRGSQAGLLAGLLAELLIGSLAGAVAMMLLAQRSGKRAAAKP